MKIASKNLPTSFEEFPIFKSKCLYQISNKLNEKSIHNILGKDNLYVVVNGFLYKVVIVIPLEITNIITSKTIMNNNETMKNYYNIQLYNFIKSLTLQFRSFSDSVKLIGLWFNKHLFSAFITQEIIEIIVSSIYISGSRVPLTPFSCFIQFMFLLYSFDFKELPFILSLNEPFSKEELMKISENFARARKSRRNGYEMYIITNIDKENNYCPILSLPGLSEAILGRIKKYAFDTYNMTTGVQFNNINKLSKLAYNTPLDGYDVTIELNTEYLQPTIFNKDYGSFYNIEVYKNLLNSIYLKSLIDFNPMIILAEELQSRFSDFFVFFYNSNGDKIYGIIDPSSFLPSRFSVSHSNHTIPIQNELIINIFDIIEEMRIVGRGLIRGIKLN